MATNPTMVTAAAAVLASAERDQYLTFMLGTEVFAIGILSIKEIIEYGALTAVPMMPDCIRGVINLRGAVVPVLDLSVRFGKTANEVTKRTCIVIVEVQSLGERHDIGVVVDAVSDVVEVIPGAIRPVPDMGTTVDTEYLKGLTSVAERMVLLLDVDRLLQPQDAQMLEAALASSEVKAVA